MLLFEKRWVRLSNESPKTQPNKMYRWDQEGGETKGSNPAPIDPLTHRTTFTFDELNRKTKTTDALLGVTTMLYDSADRMTGLIDPVGNRSTFTFDAWGDMTKETDPATKVITHVFDSNGRETEKVDRLGQKRDYTYDDAGRLSSFPK